jgi:hypothetical protein
MQSNSAVIQVAAANLCGTNNMFACSDCFRWCQGKTMREAGFVLKQLEEFARKHPGRLMRLAASPEQALAAAERHAWQPT